MSEQDTLRVSDEKNFREVLYTIDKRGRRKWVYPDIIFGKYFSKRAVVAYVLIAVYLSLPWLVIGGKQALHLDIPNREFTFFGLTLWATDTMFLAVVLAGLGISLFFFTALFGRVWCGWACPETVFLEFVFRPIERLIEGGPVQRRRLDEMPWTAGKIGKKLIKHACCAAFAWILASTSLAIFYGREPLLEMMSSWPWLHPVPFGLTVALMGVMAFQFGWFREQFCTVVCPYARFQSVLMDEHSLGVGYDVPRGEPRQKLRRGVSQGDQSIAAGDCIDCGLCVRVCPTGIDIRNGNQLECIHCTQCVDACDSIMAKVGRPPGLIRIDTEHRLVRGEARRVVSPRTYVYLALLCIYSVLFVYLLISRQESEYKVVRGASDVPYSALPGDVISNHLHLRLSNKSATAHSYIARVFEEDVTLILPGSPVIVGPGTITTFPLFVNVPKATLIDGRRLVELVLYQGDAELGRTAVTILGPGR